VIGTGPFILRSYDKGVKVVFERNPDYYMKGLPYLDGVVIEIAPDTQTRLSLLRAGKVEMAHIWGWLSPEEGRAVKQTNPEMVVTPYKVIGVGHIYMRADQPPFNDVRVRRSVIIEAIFRLPGVGHFFFEALTRLDYPVVQSVNLIIAAMVVGLNLLVDLAYAFLDPRIRYR